MKKDIRRYGMKDCMEMLPGRLKALKALTSENTRIVNLAWERAWRRNEGPERPERAAAVSGEPHESGVTQGEQRAWQII
jgi:hypothetical protein